MSLDIGQIQDKLYEILQDIDEICKNNGIEYFLTAGSALGAVRHNDFIPWDDDLDISMTRKNMEVFQKIISTRYREKYFYQSATTDPGYRIPFDKLRMNNTTFIEKGTEKWQCHQGLFVDIFPLDFTSQSRLKNRNVVFKQMIYEYLLRYGIPDKKIKRFAINLIAGSGTLEKKMFKLLEGMTCYNRRDASYVNLGFVQIEKKRYPLEKEIIFPLKRIKFRDIYVPVPNDVHKYLTILYGDYTILPPEEERIGTHGAIVDLNKDYGEYTNGLFQKNN